MLSSFFILTFLVSWILFAAVAYILRHCISPSAAAGPVTGLLFFPGVIGPSLVALALTAYVEGRKGVSDLLKGIGKWRVSIKLYVFAIIYFVAVKLGAALLYRLTMGEWPMFGVIPWYLMAIATVFSTPVQAGEEIGWRGFALPRLAQRFGFAWGSVILGIIWASWHLPFFFIPGSDNFGRSFSMYLIAVTAISVAMAWLYSRTGGSLLLVMLMHAAVDNTAGIVSSPISANEMTNAFALSNSLLAWYTVAILWICAVYFMVQMRGQCWSPSRMRLPLF